MPPIARGQQWVYRKDLQGKPWQPLSILCLQGPKFLLDHALTLLPETGVGSLPIVAVGILEAPELSVCPGPCSWQCLAESCKLPSQSATRNRLFSSWLSCVRAWAREVWERSWGIAVHCLSSVLYKKEKRKKEPPHMTKVFSLYLSELISVEKLYITAWISFSFPIIIVFFIFKRRMNLSTGEVEVGESQG